MAKAKVVKVISAKKQEEDDGQVTLGRVQKLINKLLLQHPELKDRKIVISNDNEGNGFHGMFYEITYEHDDLVEFKDDIRDSCETDPDKIVILG